MADKKNIAVTSNCTTGGFAAAFKAIFPDFEINPLPLSLLATDAGKAKFIDSLKAANYWVTLSNFDLAQGLDLRVIKIPAISFRAFHPDLTYAMKKSTQELTIPHYNSHIGIWAFNNGLSIDVAAKLFNSNTYERLGYYDAWSASYAHLKAIFAQAGHSDEVFRNFFNKVKRKGEFMYSINHPHAWFIVEVAKLLAPQIQADLEEIEREIFIPDALVTTIWPLYEEVGLHLGLQGSYSWNLDGRWINGIGSYLEYIYERYAMQNIQPNDLASFVPYCSYEKLEEVLAPQLST